MGARGGEEGGAGTGLEEEKEVGMGERKQGRYKGKAGL